MSAPTRDMAYTLTSIIAAKCKKSLARGHMFLADNTVSFALETEYIPALCDVGFDGNVV